MNPRSRLPGNDVERRLEWCRNCILEHYSQPLPLRQLAQIGATSRYQFVRNFKKAYGLAPHAYQIHVRIEKARALLARGASPANVAAETGFADQSHFGRHFLQITGVTPAQYAKASQYRAPRPAPHSRDYHHGSWSVQRSA